MEPQQQAVGVPDEASYNAREIEARAQAYWDETRCFEADDKAGNKFYCLGMFMYPSGQMHMGHVRCYTLTDVIARYNRLKGMNVLQPVGWDAFGLPAENAAIARQVPPASWTSENIKIMRHQFRRLGFAIDWSRELQTCSPDYYRWEQWMFNRLFARGLVERKLAVVNWDPVDETVLANEQVENGRGWRSGALIERREMPQWTLKLTTYADELLDGLEAMDGWPEKVRAMQRNWIGRSHGVEIRFHLRDDKQDSTTSLPGGGQLAVYTTRPDTFFGCTYVAIAPEHPLAQFAARRDPALAAFLAECRKGKVTEAASATMEKLGRPTGLVAIHPFTATELPVWVANLVLMEHGSGAVMAVPGHDQRDWEFARKYQLPIVQVIAPGEGAEEVCDLTQGAYVSRQGLLINSGEYDGLACQPACDAITDALIAMDAGERQTCYRLRDWGVSRQRYWGCPIPMILCEVCGPVPVPDNQLPVELPTEVTFRGVSSPLKGEELAEWRRVDCPQCGGVAERETDTFDTFMESSWYYARFTCADNDTAMLDARAKQWCPVDQYVGGIEHAVLHLLYARFYHRVLRDEGLVVGDEPFQRLLLLGMVNKHGKKMSKSAGNVVSPDELVDRYGADATRTFMMFGAPPDQTVEWSSSGVEGSVRFLRRLHGQVVRLMAQGPVPALDTTTLDEDLKALRRKAHATVARADDDYGRRQAFNTVVSAVMELSNEISRCTHSGDAGRAVQHEALTLATLVLSPIAPHLCHTLWILLGHEGAIVDAPWPEVDESALARDSVQLVVQVNGKVRAHLRIPAGTDENGARAAALTQPNVQRFLEGKTVRKIIHIPDKLLNLVVGG